MTKKNDPYNFLQSQIQMFSLNNSRLFLSLQNMFSNCEPNTKKYY